MRNRARQNSMPLPCCPARARKKPYGQWAFQMATAIKIRSPSANGRVRSPRSMAMLPKNSTKMPMAPIATGIPYLSRQLVTVRFGPLPPN